MRAWLTLLACALPLNAFASCPDFNADPGQLTVLEPTAGRGALSQDEITCLEASYKAAKVQTTKSKISRVELVNAYALDTTTWATLVKRHLTEVEQSDPNIAYLYAFYLYNRPQPDLQQVIKWSEVALERKTEWQGDVLINRVYRLQRVRTYAAYQLWLAAVEKKDPSADQLKNATKTYAREWLDTSRAGGKDTKDAENMCISAASRQACGLE
jgi:hypothetical protein